MAGKHAKQSGGSKAGLIIIIIAAVLIIAAVIVGVFFLTRSQNGGNSTASTAPSTAAASVAATASTSAPASASPSVSATQAPTTAPQETGVPYETKSADIVVPTEEEGEVTYFNGTYIPNGYVEDKYTGSQTTLREVFGSGYAEGAITFNVDGSFFDTLDSSGETYGSYVVQNGEIIATTATDRNLDITVEEWDGNAPLTFSIDYGDYIVYFG